MPVMGADRDEISAGTGIIIIRQAHWFSFWQFHGGNPLFALWGEGLGPRIHDTKAITA